MKYSLLFISALVLSCAKPKPSFILEKKFTESNSLWIGMHVRSDHEVWLSGTQATVAFTENGGDDWAIYKYEAGDSLQFRDIHAFDHQSAILLSAGEGKLSNLFLLNRNSNEWQHVFQMPEPDGFLNALAFWDENNGIAFGDAIDGMYYIIKTEDGGKTWKQILNPELQTAGEKEGGFASSGTNIAVEQDGIAWIGTGAGGNSAVLFTTDYGKTWEKRASPMVKGDAAGITSLRFVNKKKGIMVGGDLTIKDQYTSNLFITDNQGATWYPMSKPFTTGAFYGSAFTKINGEFVILVTGPQGADISFDQGKTWELVIKANLWTCDILPSGVGWLAGQKGAIYKIKLQR